MIKSFNNKATEHLWLTGHAFKGFPAAFAKRAIRKLQALSAAVSADKMAVPPGNRLEMLRGNRAGFWSIRINGQWRIVFRFEGQHACDVEIVDYH